VSITLWNSQPPSEGTFTYNYPGLNGGVQQFQLVWQKLSAQQPSSAYTSDYYCNGNAMYETTRESFICSLHLILRKSELLR
jgi:hypothetical protein